MADFLSRTVLIGFLTGVGIQVALGQIAGMLGLQGGGHGTLEKIWNDLQQLGQINFYGTGRSRSSVLVVIVGSKNALEEDPGRADRRDRRHRRQLGARTSRRTCHVLGAVPGGLPHLGLPQVDWSWALIGKLVPTAFAMFVVILAQSAATSRAYAARYDERFSENTDLVGLGLANIGAGLSGTFVVNGSPTKTQMVDSAGGRSQLSLLVTAAIVLLVLLFLTGAAGLHAGGGPVRGRVPDRRRPDRSRRGMRRIFAQRRSEFWVGADHRADGRVRRRRAGDPARHRAVADRSHPARLSAEERRAGCPAESGGWQPQPVASGAQAAPGLLIYRFTHSMYYANVQQLSEEITDLVNTAQPRAALALHRRFGGRRRRLLGGGDAAVDFPVVEGKGRTPGRRAGHGGRQSGESLRASPAFR